MLDPAPPYRDADRSASRYAKKPREDFKRLISDLEANDFNADILAIWESSRGSPRVGEWVDLVDLCNEKNVRIWVTTHDRLYDPANARDRRSLLEDAVDAEYESDKTSERRRRSARASAEAGRPHGKNIYGYRRVYDEQTGELASVERHPEQAPVVEEAARRILSGDSFYAVARDFNARGIPTRRPKRLAPVENEAWHPTSIKQMLQIPAYAGKRDYRGVIIGDGMWPALIEFNDWQRLQVLMASSMRRGPRDHTAKHLLSNIAICGVCRGPMRVGRQSYAPRALDADGTLLPRRTYTYYVCAGVPGRPNSAGSSRWHAGIKESVLDDIVVELVLGRIAHPDFLSSHGDQTEEMRTGRARLVAEIAGYEQYLEDVLQKASALLRFDLIVDQETRVRPLLDAARVKLSKMAAIDPIVQRLLDTTDVNAEWNSLALADQRRVVRFVITPVVHRVSKEWRGRREPNPGRVEPMWR